MKKKPTFSELHPFTQGYFKADKLERQKRELRELIAENTTTLGMSENMFDSHEEYRLNHAEAAQNLRLYRAELAALEPTA